MISKIKMAKELATVEVELAMRQEMDSLGVVRKVRDRLVGDIAKGSNGSNPDTSVSAILYEIIYKCEHSVVGDVFQPLLKEYQYKVTCWETALRDNPTRYSTQDKQKRKTELVVYKKICDDLLKAMEN